MKTDTLPESAGRPSRARSPRSRVRLELLIRSAALSRSEARHRRQTLAAWRALVFPTRGLARSLGISIRVRTISAGRAA